MEFHSKRTLHFVRQKVCKDSKAVSVKMAELLGSLEGPLPLDIRRRLDSSFKHSRKRKKVGLYGEKVAQEKDRTHGKEQVQLAD
jgi:hypothetical protein